MAGTNTSWRGQIKDSSDSSANESDDELESKRSRSNKSTRNSKKSQNEVKHDKNKPRAVPDLGSQFDHPEYKEISKENGLINKMNINEVSQKLRECGLDNRGDHQVMQKRLKNLNRCKKLEEANLTIPADYKIDYYLVIDFEATCERDNPPGFIQEIIEFPAVLLDVRKKTVVSEFHSYCRPVETKYLTHFCTELTGITQNMVDSAPLFPTVLRRFDEWIKRELATTDLFAVLTDGPWDVSRFLKQQCKLCKLELPHYFKTWVNIRKHFGNYYKVQRANLNEMLSILGMEFQGRPHSGIDDARNISRIALQLLKDGCVLKINDSLQ